MTRSRIAIRRLNADGEPEGEWTHLSNVVDLNWEQLDELAISNPSDLNITDEERVTGIIESRPGNMTFTLEGPPAKILLALFENLKKAEKGAEEDGAEDSLA